jgi:translation elongation factor EF-1alpha
MELGTVRISAEIPVVVEPFALLPGLGRFVLERAGRPAGFGIVP